MWTIALAITRSAPSSDDVLQDAAAIALSKLHEFSPGSSFPAWMGQIVRFVALNRFRSERRRTAGTIDPERVAIKPDQASPSEFAARLVAAIDALEETPRTCFLMRTLHELTYAQIAQALDIPEGTAISHVHRSRALLRTRLASIDPGGAR